MSNSKKGYKALLTQKQYLKILVAKIINRFGDSLDAVASSWIVYQITESAAWSAIVFAINRVPSVLITPLAGAWVEGRNKKAIMVVTDLIRAVCVGVVASGLLFGFLNEWIIVGTTIVISTAEAFRGPAGTALTPKILDRENIEYGLALSSTLGSIVELVGTACAAAIIALIGASGAIYIDMATFIASALIISFVDSKEEKSAKVKFNAKEYGHTLADGFRYLKKEKIMVVLLGILVFLNAITVPLNSLQAPMTEEILKGGPEVLSIIGIVITLSMVLGSIIYPILSNRIGGRNTLAVSGVCVALFYIGIVACEPFYSSKAVMYTVISFLCFILGIVCSLANSYLGVVFIKYIDEDFLARVDGITGAISISATPVVSFMLSALLAFADIRIVFLISGALGILGAIAVLCNKELKKKELEEKQKEALAEAEASSQEAATAA